MIDLEKFTRQSQSEKPRTKKFLSALKKEKPANLDVLFLTAHEKTFSETDCMACANCCKTTSPIILQNDMDRISRTLGMSTSDFLRRFLHMDEDGDFVFSETPCPFLKTDNSCSVYEDRPKACKEYPHTNRKKMRGILDITLQNSLICPAVFNILRLLREPQSILTDK